MMAILLFFISSPCEALVSCFGTLGTGVSLDENLTQVSWYCRRCSGERFHDFRQERIWIDPSLYSLSLFPISFGVAEEGIWAPGSLVEALLFPEICGIGARRGSIRMSSTSSTFANRVS